MKAARRAYDWACQKTSSPYSALWLSLIFVLEVVLFLPMDAVLMLFCMQNPQKRFTYAFVATLTSVVIGVIGYFVGLWLWDSIGLFLIQHVISESFFNRLVSQYNQYESLAVFLGGLLPIPFKAVILSAGFCKISLGSYIAALFLSRGLRFYLIAESMKRWGTQIQNFIDKNFKSLVFALGAKVLSTFLFFWVLGS